MQIFDNEFFEEYKHLDKLCSEIYDCQNGVSRYISEMERLEGDGARRVAGWDYDYRMLRHIRDVRNLIAHDPGAYQISTSEDLSFARMYYERIMMGDDALTVLRKTSVPQRTPKKTNVSDTFILPHTPYDRQTDASRTSLPQPQKEKHRRTEIACLVALIMCVLLILYMLGYWYTAILG